MISTEVGTEFLESRCFSGIPGYMGPYLGKDPVGNCPIGIVAEF